MAAKQKVVFAAIIILLLARWRRLHKKKRNRRLWVRELIRNRHQHGVYNHLLQELALDSTSYCNFVRMNATTFEELLGKVAPLIVRQDTVMRKAISPERDWP